MSRRQAPIGHRITCERLNKNLRDRRVFTLQIGPTLVELTTQAVISTIAYNDQVPGPLLRVREGQHVMNDTDLHQFVHWHDLFVAFEVYGADAEGTPPITPHGRRRYQFVALRLASFVGPSVAINFGPLGQFA